MDRIVEDRLLVPTDISSGERFDDAFVHFRHKHGSYWRWVRPVFDGASKTTANARVEFRPIPAQPTIPDTVAFVTAVAGLLTGLFHEDHPVVDLPWSIARENFYAAAEDGLSADIEWITAEGTHTSDTDHLFADLFDAAVVGLQRHGFSASEAEAWIRPLRKRVDAGLTPAGWKRRTVAAELDGGYSPTEAIHRTQRAYIANQAATLTDGHFVDWFEPGGRE